MRSFKVISVALVLVLGVGCKKKKAADPGPGTGGTMAGTGTGGTMAGSGSDTMAGSGSDTMAGSGSAVAPEPPKKEIVVILAADQKWGPMDPSAPDKSPQVAPLWGDMTKEANGFLIKVKGGSPGMAHTHSGSYHGVTLAGSPSHLQDGDKKPVALPAGSYWFQPGGVAHNSQCLGKEDCMALVHYNDGKSDFAPAELKKDGKRDAKHVEKVVKDIKWVALMPDMKDKSPMIADVWGDSASGAFGRHWKLPAGFATPAHTHASDYHGVVIKGTVMNHTPDDKAPKEMGPGSYWMQPSGLAHVTACKAGSECLMYTYSLGKFDFVPVEAAGGDM
ncbi:MAG: DUF4437 domain-containing protein, partial [Deltaproteobacteria bacterium]|nr:DUF4437 domain-containing protein [Deltaproteobacteria bacterium]